MTGGHTIRLRAPWTCEELPHDPANAPLATVRCTRPFNTPTNLAADERVWLLCDAVEYRAHFELNGRSLGTIAGHRPQPRINLTESLATHNTLVIEVDLPRDEIAAALAAIDSRGLPGGIGEVRLEIGRHAPDWQIEQLGER